MSDLAIKPAVHAVGMRLVDEAAIANTTATGEAIGMAEFDRRAGIHHERASKGSHHSHHVLLRHARAAMRRRLKPRSALAGQAAAMHGDDHHLQSAAIEVVEALQHVGRSVLERQLTAEYDALERHTLLRSASQWVDQQAFSQAKKDGLNKQLNEMAADLLDRHGDAIRAGLRNAQEFEMALDAMDASSMEDGRKYDPNALHELRMQLGAKSKGKVTAPLTPVMLAKSLQTKFGEKHFVDALAHLRSKMAGGLHTRTSDGLSPRLWLSLSDAACFYKVQSGFEIAGDLRSDLAQRARVTPKADHATAAIALLAVAESGVGGAEMLVAQIVDQAKLNNLQRMQTYLAMRHAVEKLPITMWHHENLGKRLNLLDELRSMLPDAQEMLPTPYDSADQFESGLRRRLRELSPTGR